MDLPIELQRYILSFLKFWEIQRKRRVCKEWMIIADSINPNLKDAESVRVYNSCKYVLDQPIIAQDRYGFVKQNWENKKVYYLWKSDYLNAQGQVIDMASFVKWNAKPIGEDLLDGYILNNVIHCFCRYCCRQSGCHNIPASCSFCAHHCPSLIICKFHNGLKDRKKRLLKQQKRSKTKDIRHKDIKKNNANN